jgi:MraZ protein
MPQFLGEYDCKMDAKGRMKLPSNLIKQFDGLERDGFVMNCGFEPCLVLYPKTEWDRITAELEELNQYEPKNRRFIRYFFRGASEINVDSTERILIPRKLQEYAKMTKDIIVFAYLNKIEIWSTEQYNAFIGEEPEDFSSLAMQVMGNKNDQVDLDSSLTN